jgi:hypothetical protein
MLETLGAGGEVCRYHPHLAVRAARTVDRQKLWIGFRHPRHDGEKGSAASKTLSVRCPTKSQNICCGSNDGTEPEAAGRVRHARGAPASEHPLGAGNDDPDMTFFQRGPRVGPSRLRGFSASTESALMVREGRRNLRRRRGNLIPPIRLEAARSSSPRRSGAGSLSAASLARSLWC